MKFPMYSVNDHLEEDHSIHTKRTMEQKEKER
jgi:hypothetical protein